MNWIIFTVIGILWIFICLWYFIYPNFKKKNNTNFDNNLASSNDHKKANNDAYTLYLLNDLEEEEKSRQENTLVVKVSDFLSNNWEVPDKIKSNASQVNANNDTTKENNKNYLHYKLKDNNKQVELF